MIGRVAPPIASLPTPRDIDLANRRPRAGTRAKDPSPIARTAVVGSPGETFDDRAHGGVGVKLVDDASPGA